MNEIGFIIVGHALLFAYALQQHNYIIVLYFLHSTVILYRRSLDTFYILINHDDPFLSSVLHSLLRPASSHTGHVTSSSGAAVFELRPSGTLKYNVSIDLRDDVIKWKHLPRSCSFVRGVHRWPVDSPHKGQWRRALMASLSCARINNWANNRDSGDLSRHRAHCDISVMRQDFQTTCGWSEYYVLPWSAIDIF